MDSLMKTLGVKLTNFTERWVLHFKHLNPGIDIFLEFHKQKQEQESRRRIFYDEFNRLKDKQP